ncbi:MULTISPECIES: hypothetical protein [unclassified Rhizobium]|uniref:hypothetical protein n=1 Tax=unclassified Rhizobium TaxID=2613769 RepID=UPI001613EC6A|nr:MULTISPECIES: hypothetical protein [unclassified Rhizobium]MBB3545249.1 TolB-like protein [Rhizobium sp. BK399]MCS3743227.1 TolB-like protein [Rhizobium sp. BK661]
MTSSSGLQTASSEPSDLDIQVQLERILASGDLQLPERGRRFLRYIVEETLAGRAQYLKAYTIAVSIFGRRNFDAQGDPAVRIEAGRIRRELERFYLLASQPEAVFITIPKGGYVPQFRSNPEFGRQSVRASTPASSVDDSDWWYSALWHSTDRRLGAIGLAAIGIAMAFLIIDRLSTSPLVVSGFESTPTVVVEPFDNAGNSQTAEVSRFLRDDIIVKLLAGGGLRVVTELNPALGPEHGRTLYLFHGSVREGKDVFRLTTRLVRREDGAVVRSDIYNLDRSTGLQFGYAEAVASDVVRDIFLPLKPSLSLPRSNIPQTGNVIRPEDDIAKGPKPISKTLSRSADARG